MNRSLVLVALLALTAAPGCVTEGKFDAMERERDSAATRSVELQTSVEKLQDENARLTSQMARLQGTLSERERELGEMRALHERLVGELQAELEAGTIQVQQLRDGIHVNLAEEILFATGSAQLWEGGRKVLERVSDELAKTSYQIVVRGYTDDVPIGGSLAKRYPTNWELAGARAASIVRLFEDKGIPSQRMIAVSYGENDPVAPNDTPENRAKNRRTEILLRPIEIQTD